MKTVMIIGCGTVGSTLAYTMVLNGTADVIGIKDKNEKKVLGDVQDLCHALPILSKSAQRIQAVDYDFAEQADIVVITANAPQAVYGKEMNRLNMLKSNVEMVTEITKEVVAAGFAGIFLVASNPVDILTQVVQQVSGFPAQRVIGSGTLLDSARLRFALSEKTNVPIEKIQGYVLGEHGFSCVVVWSLVTIEGLSLSEWEVLHPEVQLSKSEIEEWLVQAGFEIVRLKGATYYGIAASLDKVVQSILDDTREILPVCAQVGEIYMGMPMVVGQKGILQEVELPFSKKEIKQFTHSEKVLRENIASVQEVLDESVGC